MWFYIRYIMLPSWSWSYVSWIYNDLCDQCISPLTLWVWFPLRRGVLDTTVCDKVYQWFVQVGGFRRVFRFSPPIKLTGTEILLKVVLNTITLSYVVTVPRTTCLFLWRLFLLLIKFTKQSMYNGVSQNSYPDCQYGSVDKNYSIVHISSKQIKIKHIFLINVYPVNPSNYL
jgi:hypothetical protein